MDLMDDEKLSAFLETFPNHLSHKKPGSENGYWVFWSEYEEEISDNQSSSASDVATNRMIYENIKSVFSDGYYEYISFILQFWVPVTIGGRRLLSTSWKPFAVGCLENDFAKYRLRSLEYKYNVDETNNPDIELNPGMIISGATSRAFLNRLPEIVNFNEQGSLLDRYALECELETSFVLPICCPSQSTSCCIGVVECSTEIRHPFGFHIFKDIQWALKKVGLSVFDLQERIPYKSINGLKHVKEEIEEALKIVCDSHSLGLAQVWISFEDDNLVPFSSSLEDIRKKRMLALKLSGYIASQNTFSLYSYGCDMIPLRKGKQIVEKIFQDYESRFCKYMSKLRKDMLMACALPYVNSEGSGLVICLRSIKTGHFNYVFEFIWAPNSNYIILLESLLLTLKRCLPSFKFASGAELGDELHVIDVNNSTSETLYFKIFQSKSISPIPETMEKGKKQAIEDYIANSEGKLKTTEIILPLGVIKQQFGNTQKEAAINLNVHLSTFKRKCKRLGINKWPGPNVVKRKGNDSSNDQSKRNEKDNGAIPEPLTVSGNEDTLTIKAEYEDDTIKFRVSVSEATFKTVEKEIGMKFNLTIGTYKLNYKDEDGDWILLKSEQDMSDCIESSRITAVRNVVYLRVLPFTQQICRSNYFQ